MRTTDLLIDTDSIVLAALLKYHSQSKRQKIRRATLLNLSSSNENGMAPATFQRSLVRLENLHILQCNKIGKSTVIVFSLEMVKNTLEKKKQAQHLKFQNIGNDIEPEIWESMFKSIMDDMIQQISSTWVPSDDSKLRYGDAVTKEALSGIIGLIMSHSLEVFILQDTWNSHKSERKEAIEDLIKAAGKFTRGNPDEPFSITIHFNGFQQTQDKMSNELYHPMIQKIAPYLLMFSEHVLNHRFNKQDKFFLRYSRIDRLSNPARKCFDIFMNRMCILIPNSAYNIS